MSHDEKPSNPPTICKYTMDNSNGRITVHFFYPIVYLQMVGGLEGFPIKTH